MNEAPQNAEVRTTEVIDQEFEGILNHSLDLISQQVGCERKEFDNFKAAFETEKRVFDNGGEFGGMNFLPCETPAHSFEHIQRAVICQLIMLPGFLQAKKAEGMNFSAQEVQAVLVGELLHDIGWLRREGDERMWAGEKFFDHCQDSLTWAPELIEKLGFNFNDYQRTIALCTINATEFNRLASDSLPRQDIDARINDLSNLTWAADFLSYFSNPENSPDIMLDLYRETYARAKGKRALAYLQENTAKKEMLRSGIDEEEIVVIKSRLDQGIARVGEIKFPGVAAGRIKSVQEFVASEFLPRLLTDLLPFLEYSNLYFKDKDNWLKENYYVNIARIKTIQEIASQLEPTNPLCFLEGSLMEDDFIDWLENLRTKNIGTEVIKDDIYSQNIDLQVLGIGPHEKTSLFFRVVTSQTRDILQSVDSQDRIRAVAELFKVIKNKNKRPGGFKNIWLNLSPYAYINEEGQMLLREEDWFDALKMANKDDPECNIKLSFCLRRDKDDMTDLNKERFMDKLSKIQQKAKEAGQELQVTIGGIEDVEHPLINDSEFIKQLAEAGIKVFVYAGQVKIEGSEAEQVQQKELALANIKIAAGLAAQFKDKRVVLVGLQSLFQLEPKIRDFLLNDIVKFGLPVLFSCSTDLNTGYVKKITDHPYVLFAAYLDELARSQETWPSAVQALCVAQEFMPSSIPIEILRLLRATQLRGKEIYEQSTLEEQVLAEYHDPANQKSEKEKKQTLEDRIVAGYLDQFNLIKHRSSHFFNHT